MPISFINLKSLDLIFDKNLFLIDFKKVIANDYQELAIKCHENKLPKTSLRLISKNFAQIFINILFKINTNLDIKKISIASYIFFFNDSHRIDKSRIFKGVVRSFKNLLNENYICDNYESKTTYELSNLRKQLIKFNISYKIISKFKHEYPINFTTKLIFCNIVLKHVNLYYYISRIKFNPHSKLVFFNEYIAYQNMICQFANFNNLITFSCQHAIYDFSFKSYPRMFESFTYSIVAKYYLCWGLSSKNCFDNLYNIHKTNFIVAGHPCRNMYNGLKSNHSFSPSHFVVLLSQKKHFNQNSSLIKIVSQCAKKLNFTYTLKFHPSDNFKNYNNVDVKDPLLVDVVLQEKYVTELFNKDSICLFFATSAYYEVISLGVPCIKYSHKFGTYKISPSFNTLTELEDLLLNFNYISDEYVKSATSLIDNEFGPYTKYPSDKYKAVISQNF